MREPAGGRRPGRWRGGRGWTVLRRYAFVRQDDQSDCGAAALATIALHHRLPVGLQQMRDLAGTDRVGTNLLGLVQAAEKLGFSAKGGQGAVRGPARRCPCRPSPTCGPTRGWATSSSSTASAKHGGRRGRPGPRRPDAVPRRVLPALDGLPARAGARAERPPRARRAARRSARGGGSWACWAATRPSWSRPSSAPC